MKNILLLALLGFFSITASAQSIEVSQDLIEMAFEDVLDYNVVSFTNTSSEDITIAVRLEKRCYNIDDNLKLQVCWGDLCYPPTNADLTVWDNEITLVTLEPDASSGAFSIHQFDVDVYGSNWRLYFYDLANPSDEVFIDLTVESCSSEDEIISVVEDNNDGLEFDVYPNPASDFVQFTLSGSDNNLTASIHDLTGRIVKEVNLSNTSLTLDISDLKSGLYLVILKENGTSIEVERLIVE